MKYGFPFTYSVMKPPPPILPASGYVTASVNAIATAASTALPPSLKICSAASALYLSATATADAVSTGCCGGGAFAYAGADSRKPADVVKSPATASVVAENFALSISFNACLQRQSSSDGTT